MKQNTSNWGMVKIRSLPVVVLLIKWLKFQEMNILQYMLGLRGTILLQPPSYKRLATALPSWQLSVLQSDLPHFPITAHSANFLENIFSSVEQTSAQCSSCVLCFALTQFFSPLMVAPLGRSVRKASLRTRGARRLPVQGMPHCGCWIH